MGYLQAPAANPRGARRDATRPSAALRKVLRADEETVKAAGAGIVGARVAVFWHEDESYYKVATGGQRGLAAVVLFVGWCPTAACSC